MRTLVGMSEKQKLAELGERGEAKERGVRTSNKSSYVSVSF